MLSAEATAPARGLTVTDVARLLRVSEDKVRAWLRSGELIGVNTAATLTGKPRWVVTPESLAAFRQRRTSAPPPKPARRPRRTGAVDYFPD